MGLEHKAAGIPAHRMQSLKALQLFCEQPQNVPRTCADCPETTREGKHYCSNHVEKQPYIVDLVNRLSDRAKEDEKVRLEGSSAVNLEGITTKEILLQLRRSGGRTEERLTRELMIDKSVVHSYILRLQKEGVVLFVRTNRDNLKVVLKDFDPTQSLEDDDSEDDVF